MGHVTVYPTGTTVNHTDKCWCGYTLFTAPDTGAMLIDMDGKVVHVWKNFIGFPNKMLPGGFIMGSTWERSGQYGFQDMGDLVQLDWEGNVVWKYDNLEQITEPDGTQYSLVRQHHDYQREGSACGYYSPAGAPLTDAGKTLILCHENVRAPEISDKVLLDDKIIEVSWNGDILWEWNAREHYNEFGLTSAMKAAIYDAPNELYHLQCGDWLHINSVSWLGDNQWYRTGDRRFHPDNIILDSKEAGFIAIISRETGKLVWRLGPDFSPGAADDLLAASQCADISSALKNIGPIIGQHHAHMIPEGLPGAGNILVFDNGGWGGYGAPSFTNPDGHNILRRDYSRVLEIDPVTLEICWKYSAQEAGYFVPFENFRFYSPLVSSAQRLPNGNTLICEGVNGRIFEVTRECTLVWEYVNPYRKQEKDSTFMLPGTNMLYRAYRVPYSWAPIDPTF